MFGTKWAAYDIDDQTIYAYIIWFGLIWWQTNMKFQHGHLHMMRAWELVSRQAQATWTSSSPLQGHPGWDPSRSKISGGGDVGPPCRKKGRASRGMVCGAASLAGTHSTLMEDDAPAPAFSRIFLFCHQAIYWSCRSLVIVCIASPMMVLQRQIHCLGNGSMLVVLSCSSPSLL
jgi:hypothetical protein